MKRHVALALLTGAVFLFAADGCIVNPLFTPDIDTDGDGGKGGATSSTSSGGGTGGTMGCVCGADDNNPCTDDLMMEQACPGADEKSCHTVVVARPCTAGGKAGVCDAAGMCIACSDCSDANCTNRCIGQACTAGTDCANGKCVDGFCCDSDCTGPCNSCKRVPGICQPLPVGMTSDIAGDCSGGMVCGNTGTCIPPSKYPLGTLGGADANCESGKAVGQVCVSLNGQPCVEDLECGSRLCDPLTHKCIACGGAVLCPGGATCLSGTCTALLGQPAGDSAECNPPGVVIAPGKLMCTLPQNAACTSNSDCLFYDCEGAPNGTCAGACMVSAECPMGTTCDNPNGNGWCRLPAGSLCVINEQCQGPVNVGTCSGFPRRCQ